MELHVYKIGEKILPPTGEDAVRFQISDDGCTLLVQYNKPSAAEKRIFKQPAQFEMAIVDDIIFFLSRFGTAQWMDSPFDRSKATFTHLDIPEDGEGIALHVLVVDSSTGILISQRMIGLGTELSRRIITAVAMQPKMQNFDQSLMTVYSKYSTRDLVELARQQSATFR